MDSDSACANEPYRAIINSEVIVIVFIFSFSKTTPMPKSLSCLTYSRQSTVFRANRLIDFVITRSIFLFLHIRIMRLNSVRFLSFRLYLRQRIYQPESIPFYDLSNLCNMRSEPDMNSAVPPARWTLGSMRQLAVGDIYPCFPLSALSQELSLHSALWSFLFVLSVIFLILTPLTNSTSMV